MILSPFIAWLLFSIIAIAVLILLNKFLLKKNVIKNEARIGLIFFLVIALPFIFYFTVTNVYIINSKKDYSFKYIFGSPNFKFNNGSVGSVNFSSRHGIINNYATPLELESLLYSQSYTINFGKPNPIDIAPFSFTSVNHDIDFFPDEDSPDDVSIPSSVDSVHKYWLHEKGYVKPVKKDMSASSGYDDKTPPVEINYDDIFNEVNNNKTVIVEGYIALPTFSFSGSLNFYKRKSQFYSAPDIYLHVDSGNNKNQMSALPDKYTDNDLAIRDDSDQNITAYNHVRVTAKLYSSANYYSLSCIKIKKIEEQKANYSNLNATELSSSNMNDAKLKGQLVYAEGTIEIPDMIMSMTNYTDFILHDAQTNTPVKINIAFGNTAGKLADIPADYSPSQIRINNDNNKPINIKRKIRVYGVWDGTSIMVESINNV